MADVVWLAVRWEGLSIFCGRKSHQAGDCFLDLEIRNSGSRVYRFRVSRLV